jgi:hypothetical protein
VPEFEILRHAEKKIAALKFPDPVEKEFTIRVCNASRAFSDYCITETYELDPVMFQPAVFKYYFENMLDVMRVTWQNKNHGWNRGTIVQVNRCVTKYRYNQEVEEWRKILASRRSGS